MSFSVLCTLGVGSRFCTYSNVCFFKCVCVSFYNYTLQPCFGSILYALFRHLCLYMLCKSIDRLLPGVACLLSPQPGHQLLQASLTFLRIFSQKPNQRRHLIVVIITNRERAAGREECYLRCSETSSCRSFSYR